MAPSLPPYWRARRRARALSSSALSQGLFLAHVLADQRAGTHLVLIEPPHRTDQSHRQLHRAHFHAEHRNRQSGRERDVLADVERERGLAHARPAGDDNEIALLQSRGHVIEIGEAGRHAGDIRGILAIEEHFDALDRLSEQGPQLLEALLAARAVLRDLEHLGLGLIEDLADAPSQWMVGRFGDLPARRGEAAQDRALAHDLGVAADVGRGRHVLDQRAEVRHPTDVIELLERAQHIGDGDDVGGLVVADQAQDRAEYRTVCVAVEILAAQEVGDAVDGRVLQQQSAEHGLLRLQRMRRHFQGVDLGVVRHR